MRGAGATGVSDCSRSSAHETIVCGSRHGAEPHTHRHTSATHYSVTRTALTRVCRSAQVVIDNGSSLRGGSNTSLAQSNPRSTRPSELRSAQLRSPAHTPCPPSTSIRC